MNKILKTILCIPLIMLAFSCKNQFNELSNNSTSGYGTIYFVDSSRTVLETVEKDDFTKIILYAKKSDSLEAQKISEWKSYSDFVQSTVSVAIGTYDFYLEAFAGNVKFESDEITAEIKENQKTNINFVLHLVNRGEGNGNVIITYLFGDYNVASADFKLSKVKYEDDGNGGKIRTLDKVDVSFGGNEEKSVGDWKIWGGPNKPEQKNYCIFEKSIPAGQYELTARFESALGEYGTVAEYSTSVSVSEGITSSKEITIENFNPYYAISYTYPADAEFITDYYPQIYSMYDEIKKEQFPILTRDNYEFQGWYTEEDEKIEKISKYERTGNLTLSAKWHLDSQYMLFSKVRDDMGRELYTSFIMTSDLSSSVGLSTNVDEVIDFTIGGGDFLYYLTRDEVDSTETIKKSNAPDFDLPCDYTNDYNETDTIGMLYYDYKTDKTYGISDSMNSMCIIENENLTSYSINWNGYYIDLTLLDFATYEDKLYIVCLYDDRRTNVRRYEVNYFEKQTDNTYLYQKTINIDTSFIPDNYFYINDMICMEGKVYILWNYRYYDTGIYNYGGILCCDETKNECSQLLPYSSPENLTTITTTNPNDKTKEVSVEYQGPSDDNYTSCLFGPKKFVAIKPKKLVIADEGLFVYTDLDGNGTAEAENVNRVVTIDLDKSIESFVSQNVSVLFDENSPVGRTVAFCCSYELEINTPSIIQSSAQ